MVYKYSIDSVSAASTEQREISVLDAKHLTPCRNISSVRGRVTRRRTGFSRMLSFCHEMLSPKNLARTIVARALPCVSRVQKDGALRTIRKTRGTREPGWTDMSMENTMRARAIHGGGSRRNLIRANRSNSN